MSDRISSRMLERYLLDIEHLAHTDGDAALEAAAALPAIATALEDETTRTSYERCRAWCEEWLESPQARADSEAALSRVWCSRTSAPDEAGADEVVPVEALRQLRLRRHARPTPSRARPMGEPADLHEALIKAAHRWYDTRAGSARVQRNLARLAVLR
jgi:hypothetical protein